MKARNVAVPAPVVAGAPPATPRASLPWAESEKCLGTDGQRPACFQTMANDSSPEHLHYVLMRHVVETGHAPDLATLASVAKLSPEEAEQGLRKLNEIHGVVLAPNSLKLWSLHPFALAPTQFWVTSTRGGWWANCAWYALGIGAALREDVHILTSDGGEGQPLQLDITGGKASRTDLFMHFPYPPARWWDNPYCPCGNILFFSSRARIEVWSKRHGHPIGSILDIKTGISLAERWFGDYASQEWRRKTPDQAAIIFDELGLDRSFWDIPGSFR